MARYLVLTSQESRTARRLLGWTQRLAAKRASITSCPVSNIENGRGTDGAAARLRAAYESAGVEFTNGRQSGVRLKKVPPND